MQKNYRNPRIQRQDMSIGKCFKVQLLRTTPRIESCTGYVPLWSWSRDQVGPIGYENVDEKCFIIPVAGDNSLRKILSEIRRDKPVAEFQYLDKTGAVSRRPIADLTERDLLSVIRNLSWLVSETEDL